MILILRHVTSLLLVCNSSRSSITLDSSRIEVPDQNVRVLIPVVSVSRVVMWCVPYLTKVVVGSGEALQLQSVLLVSVVTKGNSERTVCLLVVTLSHPTVSIESTWVVRYASS